MDAFYTPDRAIVRGLQRVDPLLSVAWDADRSRWCVYHDLPHAGRVDDSAAVLARETARDYRAAGELVPYHVCLLAAHRLIESEKLAKVVAEPDGSYRPLDHRIVRHFERLDWLRRNYWLADWQRLAHTQQDQLKAERARQASDIWDSIRRDKVFQNQASDVLWGVRPTRSVQVGGFVCDS